MDGRREVVKIDKAHEDDLSKVESVELGLADGTTTVQPLFTRVDQDHLVSVLVTNSDNHALMIWRHNFITDRWGWALPTTSVALGESSKKIAKAHFEAVSGWECGPLDKLIELDVTMPSAAMTTKCYSAKAGTHNGGSRDSNEAADLVWTTASELRGLIGKSDINDAASLSAVLLALDRDLID
jgi:hypothetical protein